MDPLILGTAQYGYMVDKIVGQGGFEKANATRKIFPDGERHNQIVTDVDRRHVVLIGGTHTAEETDELYALAYNLVKQGAMSLKIVIPYFGYSTQERAVLKGECVTAKSRAYMLSTLPKAPHGNRIMLVELHVAGMQHYFEGDVQPQHVDTSKLILETAGKVAGGKFVLAAPDLGRSKQIQRLAESVGDQQLWCAIIKNRRTAEQTEVQGVVGDQVAGKVVFIYDDMIRTGGSMLKAARAYRDLGATNVYAMAAHGIFPGNTVEKMHADRSITKIVTFDTHPNAVAMAAAHPDFLETCSVAPLLAKLLKESVRLL